MANKSNNIKLGATTTVSKDGMYITLEQANNNISIKTSSLSDIKDLDDLYKFQNLLDQAVDTFECLVESTSNIEEDCCCVGCGCP